MIIQGARTPFGKLNGGLSDLTAVDLGAHAIRHALERAGITGEAVDAVIMGQVIQAGAGQGPARQAAVAAGIGWDVPTITINKICLSGLTAVIDAARLIRSGEATVVVAGGQESMSQGPHLLPRSRKGWIYGDVTALDSVAYDGLTDAFDHLSMGASTERSIAELGISREDQDAVAAASHQRATAAASDGIFDHEIAPVSIPQRKGADLVVERDEGVRANVTAESLGGLRPAFDKSGTITAGNSSPAQRRRRRAGGDHPGVRRPARGDAAGRGRRARTGRRPGQLPALAAGPGHRARPEARGARASPTSTSSRSTRPSARSRSSR